MKYETIDNVPRGTTIIIIIKELIMPNTEIEKSYYNLPNDFRDENLIEEHEDYLDFIRLRMREKEEGKRHFGFPHWTPIDYSRSK
jgi:hypothetical protein